MRHTPVSFDGNLIACLIVGMLYICEYHSFLLDADYTIRLVRRLSWSSAVKKLDICKEIRQRRHAHIYTEVS